ncbi:MAG: hypothetical protein VW985_12445 [Gammaproteobacteria bacterium]
MGFTKRHLGYLLLSTGFTVSLPVAGQPPELGRLFFTADERTRIDMIRESGLTDLAPVEKDGDGENPTQTLTVDGVIKKPDGSVRAWLNGQALDSGKLNAPVYTGRRLTEQLQLPLRLPGGLTARPKVGQVVDLSTGAVKEGYQHHASSNTAATDTEQEPSESGESSN